MRDLNPVRAPYNAIATCDARQKGWLVDDHIKRYLLEHSVEEHEFLILAKVGILGLLCYWLGALGTRECGKMVAGIGGNKI